MGDAAPRLSTSSTPTTKRTKPAVTVTNPARSTPRAVSSRDSGTATSVRTMAATAIGIFTMKNQCQERYCVNTPPTKGPIAEPMVPMEDHAPMPTPRSSAGKALLTMDSELEKNMAAPRPCTARAAISHQSFSATPHNAEPIAQITAPMSNTFRRPMMAPSRPTASSGAAKARMKGLMVHSSPVVLVLRSCPMDGRATVMPKKSIVRMNSGSAIAATTHHLRFSAVIMFVPRPPRFPPSRSTPQSLGDHTISLLVREIQIGTGSEKVSQQRRCGNACFACANRWILLGTRHPHWRCSAVRRHLERYCRRKCCKRNLDTGSCHRRRGTNIKLAVRAGGNQNDGMEMPLRFVDDEDTDRKSV